MKHVRDYIFRVEEDVTTDLGHEEIMLSTLKSPFGDGILAFLHFSARSNSSGYEWGSGTPNEQARWGGLIRDALIKADDIGAIEVIAHCEFVPSWFQDLLKLNGFKQDRNLKMVANLRQPKQKGQ